MHSNGKTARWFSLAASILTAYIGYRIYKTNIDRANVDALAAHVVAVSHEDPKKMEEAVRLLEKASNPAKQASFDDADMERLDVLTKDKSLKIRTWAFGAVSSLRRTRHRQRAIQLIARMKTDPSKNFRRGYFVSAWCLNAPDWQEEATKALNDPEEADFAREVLSRGAPKP